MGTVSEEYISKKNVREIILNQPSRYDMLENINSVPPADVRPNIHAHWEPIGEGFQCSRCGTSCAVTETADKWIWHTDDKFCRGCGAMMND